MHSKDVGMVESRGCLCLLLKTSEPVRILRDEGWQDLDRHLALERWIAGAIDLAHSACTQQAENFIAIQLRACGERHRGRIIPLTLSSVTKSSFADAGKPSRLPSHGQSGSESRQLPAKWFPVTW